MTNCKLRAVPPGDDGRRVRLQDKDREGSKRRQNELLQLQDTFGRGSSSDQLQNEQAAAFHWSGGLQQTTMRRVTVEQANRESELIDGDPTAA